MNDFKKRSDNNWYILCKRSVYDLGEHMKEYYS